MLIVFCFCWVYHSLCGAIRWLRKFVVPPECLIIVLQGFPSFLCRVHCAKPDEKDEFGVINVAEVKAACKRLSALYVAAD